MKKLFISQPVQGKTKEEVLSIRKDASTKVKELLKEDIYVIDSFFVNVPNDIKPLFVLGKAIELLSEADIAYFIKGWENYRGCRIEHQCAIEYGIAIIEG